MAITEEGVRKTVAATWTVVVGREDRARSSDIERINLELSCSLTYKNRKISKNMLDQAKA